MARQKNAHQDRRRLLRAERVHSGPIEERADGINGRISVERVDQRSSLVEHVFEEFESVNVNL